MRINIGALAVAALVAPAITNAVIVLAASVDDLIWIFSMKGANPELKSLLDFDFGQRIRQWPMDFLTDLLLAPLWAIPFGFVGAFLLLAAGFSLLSRQHRRPRNYIWTGAFVGFIHSVIGFGLRLASQEVGPTSGWEDVLGGVGFLGGFLLTSSPRVVVVVMTFIAAPIAGAVAGLIYSRLISAKQSPRLECP